MRSDEQVPSTVVADDGPDLSHRGFRLLIMSGELRGREVDVVHDPISLGKSRQCEVVLPDDSVSRIHAEIRREDGRYRIVDKGSTNGTFVGGAQISDAWLSPGDVIGLGKIELRFVPRERRAELLPSEADRFGPVIGRSLAMRRVFGVLERVADKDVTVLLRGETGTGKDLLARAIHDASLRSMRPYVVVDCGAVSGEQLEVELFGELPEDGARRRGAFELAAGGTLCLHEIDELPLDVQPKLLRVIEDRRFRRGAEEHHVDVRVIAATRRDLTEMVSAGDFREDLYFRLSVVACELPPLRERRDDIPLLIEVFSRRLPPGMWRAPNSDAMARLVGYDWPGNVRELRNVVERSAYLSPDGVIDLVTAEQRSVDEPQRPLAFDPTLTFREQKERVIERFEEAYLHWLLDRAGGNISRAAREVDMDRKYLHKLLRRYGIDAKQYAK
ncbi:sigma 54-dependent Fis family transcriptional regulator [Pseudenhygromyxa sp. WMMC2535]|nr:sigma 54-dependent Fis family transcriptional regulator [Pseudenhygromyxa sp. WMMC2535]